LFSVNITEPAKEKLNKLREDGSLDEKYAKVKKTIELLSVNPRHPSLYTHEFTSLKGAHGEKVFEAYVEQHTPNAYRILWHYGPKRGEITIIAIVEHKEIEHG
jgi:hypothetical protein